MLKIKETNFRSNGATYDYLLDNGILLHETDWNGECYTVKNKSGQEERYFPVYDSNPNINDGYDILGFSEGYPEELSDESNNEKITILYVQPDKEPQVMQIDYNLATMQGLVGGYIETVYPYDDEVALVCNEEGKIFGLAPNREIYANNRVVDIIYGNFFMAYAPLGSEKFQSIPEKFIEKYTQIFKISEKTSEATLSKEKKYIYKEINSEELRKLKEGGFDIEDNCREAETKDKYILRISEEAKEDVNKILNLNNNFIKK